MRVIFDVFLNNFVTIFLKCLTIVLINGTIRNVNCKAVYFSLLFGFQKQEKVRGKYHEKNVIPAVVGKVPLITREKRRD